ncbi:MAG: hypothetical protein ACPLRZ_00890 [Thermovenabulum sp.]
MRSIKSKMTLLFSLIIVISLAALSFTSYFFAQKALTQEAEKALVNMS